MIWAYTFSRSKELQATDAVSSTELKKLSKEADWLWVDCVDPDEEELSLISEFTNEDRIITPFKRREILSQYEKINDYLLISIVLVKFKDKLEKFPIYILEKEKTFIVVRSKDSSKSVKNTLKTFQDCILKVKCPLASSFVISRLFYEVTNENLDAIIKLRERIDEIEERALEKPTDKQISKSVFAMKREISTLERIMWTQRGIMLSIREGIIPTVESSNLDRQTLSHTIHNISRELSLINSYTNALDSILNLQDLGMIHRVEKTLIYLTLITLLVNIVMIFFEVGIFELLTS